MKKIILLLFTFILGATFITTRGFSQGTINFANNGTSLVTTNDTFHSGTADLTTTSGIKVQLFYQPDPAGSTAPASINPFVGAFGNWQPVAPPINISPVPGRFNAGQVTTGNDIAPRGNVWLEIIGWNGNAASYSAAISGGNTTGFGSSPVWSQATGDGGSVPAVPITAPTGGFTGLVVYIDPEPSTLALGALGAAVLLLFRRRK